MSFMFEKLEVYQKAVFRSPAVYSRLSPLLPSDILLPSRHAMAFAFEKLFVYQKAIDFADSIGAATEKFPKGYGFLVNQLNRAALSISANIAEGDGRFTIRDRKNFFGIARGSVQECVPLLELAKETRFS
jgi:four helix bundle protein